ncbi:MAG: hypothetical protein IJ784_11125 [Ruminiclostridium sp.]|nr:hypothetical protein [Ruminiclostridium sp.]
MAAANDRAAVIAENLSDAGLDENSIADCLKMLDSEQYAALERLLAGHRKELLDRVHEYDRKIDCLDFFTYSIRKELNGGTAK